MFLDMIIICCLLVIFVSYILKPRIIRVLIDPDDQVSFMTVTRILHAKRWIIFSSIYTNSYIKKEDSSTYEEIILIDLSIPSLYKGRVFNPLSKISTVEVLEVQ